MAVVYTSATQALAALELLVHVDPDTAPADLVAIPAVIPAAVAVRRVSPADLPAAWRAYPAPAALADIGDAWARERRTAVLAVPSALIPSEWNYLLNPAHPAFASIRVGAPAPFAFDPRRFRRRGRRRA